MFFERWVSIRRTIKHDGDNKQTWIYSCSEISKSLTANLLILSQRHDKKMLSLSDFVDGNNDNISTYWCILGIEFTLIHRDFSDKNRFQRPYVFKTICNEMDKHVIGFVDKVKYPMIGRC